MDIDYLYNYYKWSPPSRAAWIEIPSTAAQNIPTSRRRLHGRRGLKYSSMSFSHAERDVAAFTGGVD